MGVRSRLIVSAAALGTTLALAACGEDDFPNEPRPAAPKHLTALINDREVKVSPGRTGAGLVTFTISNQSEDPASLVLEGPTDESSNEIPPGGTGSLQADLEEGDYAVSGGESSAAGEGTLAIGPPRESAQNEVLQP